ncbi:DUF421 domain-containing protein [Hymenobacter glaciei]|uniref:DUF421 domain-containing protein n=1 Tax=Hymenobacter glaciei TaxID=877209 RepID=A0ABP7TME8_9BACT
MMVRAALVLFAGLVLLRISGKRSFGTSAAFDVVVKIMLGAVLSRAATAASPFWGTLLAGFILMGLHRLLAWASFRSHFVSQLVKGEGAVLAEHGQVNAEMLRRHNITHQDQLEGLREGGNIAAAEEAQAVRLERNSSISVVKKQSE